MKLESQYFYFGRNGVTAPGQYFFTATGRRMSGDEGNIAAYNGTVVGMGSTTSAPGLKNIECVIGGALAFSTTLGPATVNNLINVNFNQRQVISVRSGIGDSVADLTGWVKIKWRS